MPSEFVQYMIELGSDPDRVARLKSQPDAELAGTDLSEEEKEIVKSRDPARIRSAMVADTATVEVSALAWLSWLSHDREADA
jgi:hypothetical protein